MIAFQRLIFIQISIDWGGLGCCVGLFRFRLRASARGVRSRPPPLTPADGLCRCFWLRHRPRRAPCARRHRASTPVRQAACCADAFLWLSSRAFCVPAGGRMCVVLMCHCVLHIEVENKHGRDPAKRYTRFYHAGGMARSSVSAHRKSRTARRAQWGARTARGAHPGFGSPS